MPGRRYLHNKPNSKQRRRVVCVRGASERRAAHRWPVPLAVVVVAVITSWNHGLSFAVLEQRRARQSASDYRSHRACSLIHNYTQSTDQPARMSVVFIRIYATAHFNNPTHTVLLWLTACPVVVRRLHSLNAPPPPPPRPA